MTTKWNGKSYSLEVFCSQRRPKHTQLEEASLHIYFQVLDEHTCVGYFIDNIKYQDIDLRAAITQVCINLSGTGHNFEKPVSILLPVYPYMKTTVNMKKISFDV